MKLFRDILSAAAGPTEYTFGTGELAKKITREELHANAAVIEKLMSTTGGFGLPRISMKEALTSADASILFRKVINDTLIRPVEPQMVFSNKLAKVVSVDNARSVVFPTIGAIRAAEISENGDYPEAHPGFAEMATEVKVKKYGLVIPIGEDIIADSQWDIVGLFLEAGRFAMARLKEELCAQEFSDNSNCVINNKFDQTTVATQFNSRAQTSGRGTDGKLNGTLSYKDVFDALGVLVTNEYTPTDITVHPMMWTVFAKDPIMQFLMLQSGQAVQSVSQLGADSITGNLPWAFNVNVTPFVNYSSKDTVKIATDVSTYATFTDVATTDMFISDRNSSLVILQRDALQIQDMTDPYRDITRIKCSERYGTGTLNNGNSVVSMKSIIISENNEPVFTVRTITD